MGREELARLTDEFLARGGKVTKCPTAHPTEPTNYYVGNSLIDSVDHIVGDESDDSDSNFVWGNEFTHGTGNKRYLPVRYG